MPYLSFTLGAADLETATNFEVTALSSRGLMSKMKGDHKTNTRRGFLQGLHGFRPLQASTASHMWAVLCLADQDTCVDIEQLCTMEREKSGFSSIACLHKYIHLQLRI